MFSGPAWIGLTLAVDVWVFSETVLHVLELFDAIHSLWLGFGVDEAREGRFEVFTTWSVGHSTEALRVESAMYISLSRNEVAGSVRLMRLRREHDSLGNPS